VTQKSASTGQPNSGKTERKAKAQEAHTTVEENVALGRGSNGRPGSKPSATGRAKRGLVTKTQGQREQRGEKKIGAGETVFPKWDRPRLGPYP